MSRFGVVAFALAGAVLAAAVWWRRNPSACPYGQRFWVEMPHPFVTRPRLREILAPEPGERILEVGPGTGYYSLPVAEWLGLEGRLDLLDLQQAMLDHTMRRARERGLTNLAPTRGDAQVLPYPDGTFDAAYTIFTLGEVPDQVKALSELRRVLKPGGRLVVGELFGDPHWVRFASLERRARSAGLSSEHRLGGFLGYFVRLCPAPQVVEAG